MMMVNRKVGKGDLRANSKECLIVLTCTSNVTGEGGRSWSKVADETARQRKGGTPRVKVMKTMFQGMKMMSGLTLDVYGWPEVEEKDSLQECQSTR
jgi:hypothetical protein